MCASCHGASGEGSAEEYPRALVGDRSVPQLAKLIAKTMPSDAPGTCTGPDANKVATYIFDAFYSKSAQLKNKPPRIELSRLTVGQYRNAVVDLVGSFRAPGKWDGSRGLHGEYFRSKRFRSEERVIDRVDPEVRFDFGRSSPSPGSIDVTAYARRWPLAAFAPRALDISAIKVVPAKIDPREFAIRWQGSILAPETGDYEFIVRTENSIRLWVNASGQGRALIDATVKSGSDTEHKGTIRLMAGRAYPVRLEYFKAKEGVEDSKDKKAKAPIQPASIALEWKPPGRATELIPRHALSSAKFPESFVGETPFPPDDRSVGYERGTSVSKAWDQATTDGALEVTAYLAAHLRDLAGVREDDADRKGKLRSFAGKFAERAFRRPLSDDEKAFFLDRQFAAAKDPETAIKRSTLLVLKSPRFLYRELGRGKPDAYDVASRLSFGLWDSIPDQTLLDLAASGKLATKADVARQAERMVDDLRTRGKLRQFLFTWLRVDAVPDIAKDPKLYPDFDPAVVSDLRTSLDLFLDAVAWGDKAADFRQLLLADSVYLNGRLAKFYGVPLPVDAPFQKVALDRDSRAGILTHPYLMATFAYTATSSPIHRGVFLMRSVLGRVLRPPPEAVAPLAPDLHAGLSTRERVTLQTSPNACASCHTRINPLGFGLENFDAVGRFRAMEKGKPIDATGSLDSRSGESSPYRGARELAALLVKSDETHAAFVEQLFHHLIKQPIRAYGPRASLELRKAFVDGGFSIRKLLVEVMASSALAPREYMPTSSP